MIKGLYGIMYYSKSNHSGFLYKVIKKIIICFIETFYPIFSRFFSYEKDNYTKNFTDEDIIISLTTYSKRIEGVHLTIRTLLKQTHRYNKIILWLSQDEYSNLEQLPYKLRDLLKYGLEIRFCEDLKSHKKYYYSMLEYPQSIIITVDDDTYYPENLVEDLIKSYLYDKKSISFLRGHLIKLDSIGDIAPYSHWDKDYMGDIKKSILFCPTGCQGVLYPPNTLDREIFNRKAFMKECPNADDLWLKIMAIKQKRSALMARKTVIPFASVKGSQKNALYKNNTDKNQNDVQLKNLLDAYPEIKEILNNSIIYEKEIN
ncbi:hypothetical protein [Terribacillus saccharophilus]|uniref:hypothetical protein n=1 Tax=Terribacillus saccharophilus TaxID=361277 RepID=UPI002DCE29DF|nr:hypothetical protein [Terribacillus saccharophilus]